MNIKEAKEIIERQSNVLDNNKRFFSQTEDQEYALIEALSYLQGREAGIKEAAEIANLICKRVEIDRSETGGMKEVLAIKNKILSLLEQKP